MEIFQYEIFTNSWSSFELYFWNIFCIDSYTGKFWCNFQFYSCFLSLKIVFRIMIWEGGLDSSLSGQGLELDSCVHVSDPSGFTKTNISRLHVHLFFQHRDYSMELIIYKSLCTHANSGQGRFVYNRILDSGLFDRK